MLKDSIGARRKGIQPRRKEPWQRNVMERTRNQLRQKILESFKVFGFIPRTLSNCISHVSNRLAPRRSLLPQLFHGKNSLEEDQSCVIYEEGLRILKDLKKVLEEHERSFNTGNKEERTGESDESTKSQKTIQAKMMKTIESKDSNESESSNMKNQNATSNAEVCIKDDKLKPRKAIDPKMLKAVKLKKADRNIDEKNLPSKAEVCIKDDELKPRKAIDPKMLKEVKLNKTDWIIDEKNLPSGKSEQNHKTQSNDPISSVISHSKALKKRMAKKAPRSALASITTDMLSSVTLKKGIITQQASENGTSSQNGLSKEVRTEEPPSKVPTQINKRKEQTPMVTNQKVFKLTSTGLKKAKNGLKADSQITKLIERDDDKENKAQSNGNFSSALPFGGSQVNDLLQQAILHKFQNTYPPSSPSTPGNWDPSDVDITPFNCTKNPRKMSLRSSKKMRQRLSEW